MAIRSLLGKKEPAGELSSRSSDPFFLLQREMDRMFQDFSRGFGLPAGRGWEPFSLGPNEPRVDMRETDKELVVEAELPGLQETDIEVSLSREQLKIKGEKRAEVEEKEADRYYSERAYGAFERTVPLPVQVEEGKADASFKNGVLSIRLPKSEEARNRERKVPVRAG